MLAEAVASVAAQTLRPDAHLIAVDYHRNGPSAGINRMVKQSRTEWLSILADDDLYDPDHLEILMAHTADADMVLSWSRFEGRTDEQFRGEFSPYDLLQRQDTGMRGCFLFRRALWDKLGGWPDGAGEDWQFMVAAIRAKARLVPVYRETWTYRWHDGNISLTY